MARSGIWRARVAGTLSVCGLTLALASAASAQAVGYTAALYVVRATYPTARVDSLYLFNTVDISGGPARLAVTLPVMRIESTPTAPAAEGSTPALATMSSGLGDPLVRFDVRVVDDRSRALQLGLAGAVKLPVVDASTGRGSGMADYGVGGSAFKAFNRTSLMADVLFWKYGDPEGVDFTDTLSYSVGAARVVGAAGRWSALASLSGFSSGIDGQPPPLALNIGILRVAGRGQSLAISSSFGLNDSSSDFVLGMGWRIAR